VRHRIVSRHLDTHPYEILEVELIADSVDDDVTVGAESENIKNYLLLALRAITVIQSNPPIFIIRRAKANLDI